MIYHFKIMTQEQKEKLEQAAAAKYALVTEQNYWIAGAQTILDNPGEWGLYPNHQDREWASTINNVMEDNASLRAQNDRYRKALERIADPIGHMESQLKEGEQLNGMAAIRVASDGHYLSNIAKEVLKQEEMK